MSVLRRNLTYYSGLDTTYSFSIYNSDGSPRSFTGKTVQGIICKNSTSNDVTEDEFTPVSYPFTITVSGNTITSSITDQSLTEGKYMYFIKETVTVGGVETLLVSGMLDVLPGWIKEQ